MAAVSWKNPVTGDWTDAADWSTGTVPGADDNVRIGPVGTYTVSVTSPVTVHSITVSDYAATLAITDPGKTVTVSGDFSDRGTLAIDASGTGGITLKVAGTLSVIDNTGIVEIGNSAITRATTVIAAALDNTSAIAITGGQAQATLSNRLVGARHTEWALQPDGRRPARICERRHCHDRRWWRIDPRRYPYRGRNSGENRR